DRAGEYLAGINPVRFELRFAVSGGFNQAAVPYVNRRGSQLHLAFAPPGEHVAFGWNDELRVMHAPSGQIVKNFYEPKNPFRDVAFTANGRHLASVADDGLVTFRDAETWEKTIQFDWKCGPLRCLAFSPDGACGVCGTANGKIIVFDVDG